MLLYMPFNNKEEEEGIMISFGDEIEGLGDMAPLESVTQPVIFPPQTPPVNEELITQNIEETIDLQAQEHKRQEQIQAEQLRKEELERKRKEAERIAEQQRIEAEKAKKTEKANQTVADALNKQNVGGVGQAEGNGTAGNPVGQGLSGGHSWSLEGRNLIGKIYEPIGEIEDGKVVVEIRVNQDGNVISATSGQGTTIGTPRIVKSVLEAARKTKFSAGTSDVIGTITYNFKLK